jgi:DnaJ family protein A protein 2
LVTKEQPHDVFTRKGADLYMKKHITLIQALLGFNFTLTHLDGRNYNIYTQPGEIVGDSDRKIVKDLGMPFFRDEDQHGHLVI